MIRVRLPIYDPKGCLTLYGTEWRPGPNGPTAEIALGDRFTLWEGGPSPRVVDRHHYGAGNLSVTLAALGIDPPQALVVGLLSRPLGTFEVPHAFRGYHRTWNPAREGDLRAFLDGAGWATVDDADDKGPW